MDRHSGITRHHGASTPATPEQRAMLRALRDKHQLPEYGTVLSVNTMLDILYAVIDRGEGISYDANKLADWIRRFPLRTTAARVERYQDWAPETREAIAELVLMRGHTPARVAAEYGTTSETVDAIVADYRLKIRKGETQ